MMKKLSLILLFCLSGCAGFAPDNSGLLVGDWLENTPDNSFVQGISLKSDGSAASINMATLQYEKWHLKGNKLVLSGKSIGNHQTINFSEETQVVEINKNTLKIRQTDGYTQTYRRRKDTD